MKQKFLVLMLLAAVFTRTKAQVRSLPDEVLLNDLRFFKNKSWHDTIFPENRKPIINSLRYAFAHGRQTKDTSLEIYAGVVLARRLMVEKIYDEAFDIQNRILLLDTLLHPLSPLRQYIYNEAYVFYNNFGTHKIAKKFLKKTIEISEMRDSIPTGRLYGYYSSYAGLCRKIGQEDSSSFYYLKAIETGKKINNQWWAAALNNYGMMLLSTKKPDSAMSTFTRARNILTSGPYLDTSFYYSICDNIAEVHATKKENVKALSLFDSKFNYHLRTNNWRQVYNAGIRSAMMMVRIGELRQAEKRMRLIDSIYATNSNNLDNNKKEDLLRLKLELALQKGDNRAYTRLQQKLIELKENVITDAVQDRLGKLESVLIENTNRFNQEIEIEKLKSEESASRARFNSALAGGAIISGALVIAIIILLYRRRIVMNRVEFQQESYKRKLAETTLINEQLSKNQLKQQLELNRVTVEQESYKRELAESNLKNEQLEKEYFSQQLELKKRDVTDYALAYSQRKKILDEVLNKIKDIKKSEDPVQQLQELGKSLKKQLQGDSHLEVEPGRIEQVNHEFFEKLAKVCPDLTPGEKDLTGLIRLNFSNKEISSLRNVSPITVRISKMRLKKKLGLTPELDLTEFIQKL